jgi:hypothetical protein
MLAPMNPALAAALIMGTTALPQSDARSMGIYRGAKYKKGKKKLQREGYGQCSGCRCTLGRSKVCMNRACKQFNGKPQ